MKKIGVGIIGCGVVGSAVIRNLINNSDDITARSGLEIAIIKIADHHPDKKKSTVPNSARELFTDNLDDILNNDSIDIVVELIGGIDVAFKSVQTAINRGKHIVTANKHLLAERGEEIYKTAIENSVEVGFEASVAGAIPIIRMLKEGIAGGEIKSIHGIINGTANYILTKMTQSNADFNAVLKEAQELGYAEADPTFDIEGQDAAHKIAIMAALAYGTPVDFDLVFTQGISRLSSEDFNFAKEFGKVIKLLGIAKLVDGKLDVRVHPAMLDCSEPLARIDGVLNAVQLEVSHADNLMLVGAGAGGDPTSSAVIADIVEIARNISSGSVRRVSPVAFEDKSRKKRELLSMDDIEGGYYLRFHVEDKPGVLSKITGILGSKGISVGSAIQRTGKDNIVPLVILTHKAREKDIQNALIEIDGLETTKEKTLLIRLINNES